MHGPHQGRLGSGGLELHPTIAGEEDFRPGVGVLLEHLEGAGGGVGLALVETNGQPGRNAERAQHDHFGRGVIVAVAAPSGEKHVVHRLHAGRRRVDVLVVGDVLAQPVGDGLGLVVGRGGAGLLDDLPRQVARALGHLGRHL